MMHFPFGIEAHPVYAIDTPEEAAFWARIKEAHRLKNAKKEEPTMQVSYNGFTGELAKLERYSCGTGKWTYELNIYDSEKKCAHLFAGVKPEDVKFLGGAVSFGG